MTGLQWTCLVVYAFTCGIAFALLLEDASWRRVGGWRRCMVAAVGFAVAIVWPLLVLTMAVARLWGSRVGCRCMTCGAKSVARWDWLAEVKWMLHARRSPKCLQGRTLGAWVIAWLKLRLFGISAPPSPARKQ